jgi:hypothetical protein
LDIIYVCFNGTIKTETSTPFGEDLGQGGVMSFEGMKYIMQHVDLEHNFRRGDAKKRGLRLSPVDDP